MKRFSKDQMKALRPWYYIHRFHLQYKFGLMVICPDGFRYLDGWSDNKKELMKRIEKEKPVNGETRIIIDIPSDLPGQIMLPGMAPQ